MKRFWIVPFLLLALVACSDTSEDTTSTGPTNTEESVEENEAASNISEQQEDGTELALTALANLENNHEYKTVYFESYTHHPELDPYEIDIDMTFSESEQFMHKLYIDNFLFANYESFLVDTSTLYIKNEYTEEPLWMLEEGRYDYPNTLSSSVSEMLQSIVKLADYADLKDGGDGTSIVHVYMTSGDFTSIAQQIEDVRNILMKVGVTEEIIEDTLDDDPDNITNIAVDLYINEQQQLTYYQLFYDFDNGEPSASAIIEQSFEEADLVEKQDQLANLLAG